MHRYRYKAKDSQGKLSSGVVEASDHYHAARLVKQKGFTVISISSADRLSLDLIRSMTGSVSSAELTNFTRQFATMITSGLPITEALQIMRMQVGSGMQKIIGQMLADVEEGQSLSSSAAKHPKVFSKTYVALLRSGELGGVLDEVLAKLSENMERQQEFRGKVKGALIYPVVIVIAMIVVVFIMMVFVLPRIMTLYDQFDAELPIATKILMFASNTMSKYWYVVIAAVVFLIYSFRKYKSTALGGKKLDELFLKIPLIGPMQKEVILTDVTRTMGLMVGSGVSVLESLQISTEIVKNSLIRDAISDVSKMIEKGFPMALSFAKHPEAFPPILTQMIAVGEETGKMDEVLAKVSHIFEVESEQKVKGLTAAFEPLVLVFLGIGVAFIVLAVVMPIYKLTTAM